MLRLAQAIDRMNTVIGRGACWLLVIMVVAQFTVVLSRYIFGYGSVWLQEALIYMHGYLFMLAAAFTLRRDGHVRVDLFYRTATARTKALVNLVGSVVFLLPMCAIIAVYCWPYVYQSWLIGEGSRESSGIQALFLLKSAILMFAVQMALQGAALVIHSILALRGWSAAQPHQAG